jgi:hypothetical protein
VAAITQEEFHGLFEKLGQLIAHPVGERLHFAREIEAEIPPKFHDLLAMALKGMMPFGHKIVLVHGIRDDGAWFEPIRKSFGDATHVEVSEGGYGYLQVGKFLTRRSRERALAAVVRTLRAAQGPMTVVSVICHSFGTYCVTKAILEHPDIRLFRLLLCGSVVQREFNWSGVNPQIPAGRIVNDCGNLDPWPVWAKRILHGVCGDTGRFGFGHSPVRDRWHEVDHSGFFNASLVERFWVPFLMHGRIVDSMVSFRQPGRFLRMVSGRWPL